MTFIHLPVLRLPCTTAAAAEADTDGETGASEVSRRSGTQSSTAHSVEVWKVKVCDVIVFPVYILYAPKKAKDDGSYKQVKRRKC